MAQSTAELARSALPQRLLVGALWLGVAVVTAVLVVRRFVDATAATGIDLESFYLPAARAVAEGTSPYDVEGYVYTPLVAMLLAPVADADWVVFAWKGLLIAAAVVACLLGVLASTPGDSTVRRPLVMGVAVVSVLYSWPMAHDLWFGQANVFILVALTAAMLSHVRDSRLATGFALGLGAVVKTWPAGLMLWLLRSPLHPRSREWLGVGLATAMGLALTLVAGGLGAVTDLLDATVRYSDQDLVAYSVWGAGDYLFTGRASARPIHVSPLLGRAVSWCLGLVLLGLLLLVLRRPGNSVVALSNVMFLLILLVPVAHDGYAVLALPVVWWWTARALERPLRVGVVPAAVLAVWWVVAMRVARTTAEGTAGQAQYVLILTVSLVAVATSVVCAARIGKSANADVERIEPR